MSRILQRIVFHQQHLAIRRRSGPHSQTSCRDPPLRCIPSRTRRIETPVSTTREHLQNVDESYFEHQCHAAGYGWRLMRAGLACFVHALLPSRCVGTASDEIIRLRACEGMKGASRRPRALVPQGAANEGSGATLAVSNAVGRTHRAGPQGRFAGRAIRCCSSVARPCQAPLLAPGLARPAKRQDAPSIPSQALSEELGARRRGAA